MHIIERTDIMQLFSCGLKPLRFARRSRYGTPRGGEFPGHTQSPLELRAGNLGQPNQHRWMRSVVIGDVVDHRRLLEQSSTPLDAHGNDDTIDLSRFVYGRASHHLATQLQRPGPVIRAFLDIRKLESNLEDGIQADRGAAHSEISSVSHVVRWLPRTAEISRDFTALKLEP